MAIDSLLEFIQCLSITIILKGTLSQIHKSMSMRCLQTSGTMSIE